MTCGTGSILGDARGDADTFVPSVFACESGDGVSDGECSGCGPARKPSAVGADIVSRYDNRSDMVLTACSECKQSNNPRDHTLARSLALHSATPLLSVLSSATPMTRAGGQATNRTDGVQ